MRAAQFLQNPANEDPEEEEKEEPNMDEIMDHTLTHELGLIDKNLQRGVFRQNRGLT